MSHTSENQKSPQRTNLSLICHSSTSRCALDGQARHSKEHPHCLQQEQQSLHHQSGKKQGGGNLALLLLKVPSCEIKLAPKTYQPFRQARVDTFCPADQHCKDREDKGLEHMHAARDLALWLKVT